MHDRATTEVPRWAVHELALVATGQYTNPYTQADVSATFLGPDGARKTVAGFWDGGDQFRIRFTPTIEGEWTYATRSADPGLDGHIGTLRRAAPVAGESGFVRRDPDHPRHFIRDNGDRHFVCGQTYYEILRNALADGGWRAAIDGSSRRGMTKVRLLVHPVWDNPHTPYPPTAPFGDDHDALNLAHWRALDTVVAYLHARGMVADLIPFANEGAGREGQLFGTRAQDERYLRYLIARYAAYPHAIWCLTNEWNYTGKDRDYWNGLGRIARDEDPWGDEAGRRRVLTIHQQTRIDWQWGDADWPTALSVQYGVRNGQRTKTDEWADDPANQARYPHGDDWGNASVVHNLRHRLPVVNDEYGYIGEPSDKSAPGSPPLGRDKHRCILWGIYVAGGYAAAGDKTTYADGRPYMSAAWHDTAEYGDIERLARFFTNGELAPWRMSVANDLVQSGERVYVLAEPGQQYLIYAANGGPFTLALPAGDYAARRYDLRTGAETPLDVIQGDGTRTFSVPAGDDWVVLLTRMGTEAT